QIEHQAAKRVWSDLEGFCRRVRSRLDEATFAERQRILQLLIERVIVGEDSLEIRHVIPLGQVDGNPSGPGQEDPPDRAMGRDADPRRSRATSRFVDCVRMVWNWHRCHGTPVSRASRAGLIPPWASLTTIFTP